MTNNRIYTSDIEQAMYPQAGYYPKYQPPNPVQAQKYLHTPEAGAVVPLLQASVTGLLFGLIAVTLLIWQNVNDWPVYAILVWLGSTSVTWLSLQKHWMSLTTIERFTGIDINQDGVVGDVVETSPAHVVRVDLRQDTDDGYKVTKAELPIDESALCVLAGGLMTGRPLSEREWCGTGKPLSSLTYRNLIKHMVNRQLIEQVNPKDTRQGYKLTRVGKAAMSYFAGLSVSFAPSPSPLVESEFTQ